MPKPGSSTSYWPAPPRGGRLKSFWKPSTKTGPGYLVGPDAKVLDAIVRVTGSGYQRLFLPVVGRMKPPSR